jgi:UDP-N-acetylmuramate dehydrogenase
MHEMSDLTGHDFGDICINEPLAPHSSWKIGGPADIFIEPYNIEQISNVLQYAKSESIPLVVIGNATNLLFCDEGVRGIVMRLGEKFSQIQVDGTHVHAEAGTSVPTLAKTVGALGLTGLEHTVGIPATLGGLVYMNGGSQGKCIGDHVRRVSAIDRSKGLINLSREECCFSYRHSSLQGTDQIVCTIDLELDYGDPDQISHEMQKILENRQKKFPVDLPSCGSVFTSPPYLQARGAPPGKLIEDAGLKGFKIGDAQVSECHANFIVNLGNAKAQDIIDLVRHIRETIHTHKNVRLDAEVRYVGPDGRIVRLHQV